MEKKKVLLIVCRKHQMIRKFGRWQKADITELLCDYDIQRYEVKTEEAECPECKGGEM
jgi:hypothetical protein